MGNIIFWALSFGVVTLGALLSVMVLAALGTTRARLRYRKLGYRVRWFRGNHFVYEEPLPGEIGVTNWWTDFLIGMSVPRALSVSGIRRVAFEMLPAKASSTTADRIIVPGNVEWMAEAPDWAKQRREEIVNRIINWYDGKPEASGSTRRLTGPSPE